MLPCFCGFKTGQKSPCSCVTRIPNNTTLCHAFLLSSNISIGIPHSCVTQGERCCSSSWASTFSSRFYSEPGGSTGPGDIEIDHVRCLEHLSPLMLGIYITEISAKVTYFVPTALLQLKPKSTHLLTLLISNHQP